MTLEEFAAAIDGLTYNLWCCTIHGNQSHDQKQIQQRMGNSHPGDLVVERSTHYYQPGDERMKKNGWENWRGPLDRVGYLLRVETITRKHEDCDEDYDTTYHVIRTLDGREIAWNNCHFLRVCPENVERE